MTELKDVAIALQVKTFDGDSNQRPPTFRHRSDRRLPAVHVTEDLSGRLRHLLREDRVRAGADPALRSSGNLLQLQPALPPKTVSVHLPPEQILVSEIRRRQQEAARVVPSPGPNHLPKVRLPLPGDAGQRAMPAQRHV